MGHYSFLRFLKKNWGGGARDQTLFFSGLKIMHTVCPRNSDPFYIITYYINWVTTSWTDGIFISLDKIEKHDLFLQYETFAPTYEHDIF